MRLTMPGNCRMICPDPKKLDAFFIGTATFMMVQDLSRQFYGDMVFCGREICKERRNR